MKRLFTLFGLLALFALYFPLVDWGGHSARADNSTPTTIQDTPQASPQLVITPESPPTLPPVVSRERSTPVTTFVPVATEAPVLLPTSSKPRPQSRATPIPTAASLLAPPPSLAPLPSPAQLRMDARLRWGTHIPAAVRQWAFLIVPAARKYHIDPNIIAAVMTMESGGDPLALSGSDARGLMQILHGPWDPRENIYRGAQMLASLHAQFGDWKLALAAYNAGPNAVLTYGGIPPYRETRDYVIIVAYLFDLYSHRPLTQSQRQRYRSTVKDLQHFARERRKVSNLVHAGLLSGNLKDSCGARFADCQSASLPTLFQTGDPFWPLTGSPDPLQHVDPFRPGSG